MILAVLLVAQTAAPLRHLVFDFTYAATRSVTTHSSGFDQSGSGVSDAHAYDDAKGTIVVDVLRVGADKGLVLSVSEQADNADHQALPVQCLVYPISVSCQTGRKVTPEEASLVRLLADGFVDPARIDANNHWKIDDGGPGSAGSDYTVLSNDNNALKIDERRAVGTGVNATTVTGTIGYNLDREVVTSLNETLIDHPITGNGSYVNDIVTFNATLQFDSMAH